MKLKLYALLCRFTVKFSPVLFMQARHIGRKLLMNFRQIFKVDNWSCCGSSLAACVLRLSWHVSVHSGDNILTAVSVARQCGLVPADDRLVLVNAYLPDDQVPARIDWVCHEDSSQASGAQTSNEVILYKNTWWSLYTQLWVKLLCPACPMRAPGL